MKACRSCGSHLGQPFLSLGNSPNSNAYLSANELDGMEAYFPLDLYLCPLCFLVQLDQYQPIDAIFSEQYAYFSSYSESWLEHCRRYADSMVERYSYGSKSFVIEVASNDGYLLQYFVAKGIPVLGIEPAANTARAAVEKGIPTLVKFFNADLAASLAAEGKRADLLIGNNVLAHTPDLDSFVRGLQAILKPDGVITMEFPHLLRLIEHNQYDTIYHEHFSYFSLFSAMRLFGDRGLTVFDVDELPTHGGSIRIYAGHRDGPVRPGRERVQELLERERRFGLQDSRRYADFEAEVHRHKRELLLFLIEARNRGRRVVCYGAPAKGNTLLNYCGIRTDLIDYTVDRSPHKQNRFLPGSHIPVLPPDRIRQDRPDYVLILPWNIADEIRSQLSFVREWGGQFVVPIPRVEVD